MYGGKQDNEWIKYSTEDVRNYVNWVSYGLLALGYNKGDKIARKLIFSKWQEALGGELQVMVSGGAALQSRLEKIFWAADLPGELSPTLKLRRSYVAEKYKDLISGIYFGNEKEPNMLSKIKNGISGILKNLPKFQGNVRALGR